MPKQTIFDFFEGSYRPSWRERLDIAVLLVFLYVASGVAVNVFAKHFPKYIVDIPWGDSTVSFPIIPGTLLVGLIFVMRDYTQRLIGNWVICWTLVASAIVYFAVDEFIALHSAAAFLISEGIDQLAWRWLGKSELKDRILWSSFVSTPFDGYIILRGLNELDGPNFISHFIGKMASVFVIWLVLRHLHNKKMAQEAIA